MCCNASLARIGDNRAVDTSRGLQPRVLEATFGSILGTTVPSDNDAQVLDDAFPIASVETVASFLARGSRPDVPLRSSEVVTAPASALLLAGGLIGLIFVRSGKH